MLHVINSSLMLLLSVAVATIVVSVVAPEVTDLFGQVEDALRLVRR